jgi:hypothetical protein
MPRLGKLVSIQPNKELARKLRLMVEATTLDEVCRQIDIGREPLKDYLAGLPMRLITFRGVEAIIADAELRIDDDK